MTLTAPGGELVACATTKEDNIPVQMKGALLPLLINPEVLNRDTLRCIVLCIDR